MKEIILAVIGSGALSAVISGIVQLIQQGRQKTSGLSNGLKMLLYDRIKYLGKKYIARGSITIEELEDITAMHQVYHNDLHGNGFLDSLMESVMALPKQ